MEDRKRIKVEEIGQVTIGTITGEEVVGDRIRVDGALRALRILERKEVIWTRFLLKICEHRRFREREGRRRRNPYL
jgi:hypothetical protein